MKFRTLHKKACLAALLLGCLNMAGAQDEKPVRFQFRGFLKNLQTWSWAENPDRLQNDGFLHNRLIFKVFPDSNWTFDLETRNRVFYGESVKSVPDYYAGLLDRDPGFWDGSFNILKNDALIFNTQIDRLWLGFDKNNWQIRLGRQRINWGIATTWNPNDLFNAWNFLDFDYEERPGSDALRVRRAFGGFSAFELAVSPARDGKKWIAAVRYGTNWKNYDFQWLAGRFRDQWTLGFGWAGRLGQAGFKGEASVFKPEQGDSAATLSLTMQIDHLFPKEWYVSGGFLYAGAAPNGDLNPAALATAQLSPDRLMPVRWSLLASVARPITPILTASFTAVYSPKNNFLIAVPTLAYNIRENWDIDLTGQIFLLETPPGGRFRDRYAAVFLRTRWSF